MNIAFYNFTKRRNSTKLPSGTGTIKDCKLKDNCSVHNPVILLANSPVLYDYAYIQAWSRYYFVEDIISVANGLTEYHLVEDVLASNKIAIGNAKAHIAYASNNYNDFIIDPRMEVSTVLQPQNVLANAVGSAPASPFNGNNFIITVFNNSLLKAAGMCSSYFLDSSDLGAIANWLSNPTIISDLSTYFNGNPLSGISSCKWVPYAPDSIALDTNAEFKIGDKTLTGRAVKELMLYNRPTYTYYFQWDFHQDFRRVSPFTKGLLYLPGVGNVEVNLADFAGSDYMYVDVCIEVITGDVTYFIRNKNQSIIASYSCNVAADIPIGATLANVGAMGNSVIGTLGGVGAALVGAVTGNAMLGFGGVATAVTSASNVALEANKKTTTVSGGQGSRGVSLQPALKFVIFTSDTMDPEDADYIAVMGRPVGDVAAINTFSGFVQTIDAHVALNATAEEMDEVNRLLDGGIYYE